MTLQAAKVQATQKHTAIPKILLPSKLDYLLRAIAHTPRKQSDIAAYS